MIAEVLVGLSAVAAAAYIARPLLGGQTDTPAGSGLADSGLADTGMADARVVGTTMADASDHLRALQEAVSARDRVLAELDDLDFEEAAGGDGAEIAARRRRAETEALVAIDKLARLEAGSAAEQTHESGSRP